MGYCIDSNCRVYAQLLPPYVGLVTGFTHTYGHRLVRYRNDSTVNMGAEAGQYPTYGRWKLNGCSDFSTH